jgi:hypothetical protein
VRDARQQDLVEVAQHVREGLAVLGRRGGQLCTDIAGLDLREHGQIADTFEVLRGPLDRGRAVVAEAHFCSFLT